MSLPKFRNGLWWFGWLLLSALRPFVCRLRIEGQEHVPPADGAVIAANHTVGADFVFLAYCSPRELKFMTKAEAFTWNPLLTWLLRSGGAFPVRRGQNDQAAIDTAVELARAGGLIAMFPEGTRSRTQTLMKAKTGAARIALAAGVPIVPAAVIGAPAVMKRRTWRRPLVTVRFGAPISWTGSADDPESVRRYIDTVMVAIAEMLPPEQRGVYAHGVPVWEDARRADGNDDNSLANPTAESRS
jgi:1-acyl-sn-glycerol-3-phosphate acyltransferase